MTIGIKMPEECPECDGMGKWLDIDGSTIECSRCKGTGWIEKEDVEPED